MTGIKQGAALSIGYEHDADLLLQNFSAPAVYQKTPHILLVDDDPIYCKMMARTARDLKIDLRTCKSMSDVLAVYQDAEYFDVAILDYSFGTLTAEEVAPLLNQKMPLLLISQNQRSETSYSKWPYPIRSFLPKSLGNASILQTALGYATHTSQTAIDSERAEDIDAWIYEALGIFSTGLILFAISLTYLSLISRIL
jgi:DNA-binding NtrC family response regulator